MSSSTGWQLAGPEERASIVTFILLLDLNETALARYPATGGGGGYWLR